MAPSLTLYRRLLRYVRPYWWAFALAILGMVIVAGFRNADRARVARGGVLLVVATVLTYGIMGIGLLPVFLVLGAISLFLNRPGTGGGKRE